MRKIYCRLGFEYKLSNHYEKHWLPFRDGDMILWAHIQSKTPHFLFCDSMFILTNNPNHLYWLIRVWYKASSATAISNHQGINYKPIHEIQARHEKDRLGVTQWKS